MHESKETKEISMRYQTLWEITKVILISCAIVLPIRYFIVQPFIVRGASMEPNFQDQQYLVIDELSYYLRMPHRGEVIVFHYPNDTREYFIKRVIGLPGESITIHDGGVRISNAHYPDGFALDESYLPAHRLTYPDTKVTLGQDEYFVMGDNRSFSYDSRGWGPLNKKYIVGHVVFRAWPPSQFGLTPATPFTY